MTSVAVAVTTLQVYNLNVASPDTYLVSSIGLVVHNTNECKPDVPKAGAQNFDQARREGFEKAGMTNPADVRFTKVDPKTGAVVEFKGKDGAKVAYDAPHDSPGPHHDKPHVGWQSGGKRNSGGANRGNIPYEGPQHPSRSNKKGEGSVEEH